MKIKSLISLFLLIHLAACTSHYRSRMVRVKTDKTEQKTRIVKHEKTTETEVLETASVQVVDSMLPVPEVSISASTQADIELLPNEIPSIQRVPKPTTKKPKNSPKDDDPKSVDFVKEQYKRANNLSYWSLGLLVSIFLTSILGLIAAFVTSLLAVRIYYKYKNPGVDEKFVLAMVVLVISSLLILLTMAAVIVFFTLLI